MPVIHATPNRRYPPGDVEPQDMPPTSAAYRSQTIKSPIDRPHRPVYRAATIYSPTRHSQDLILLKERQRLFRIFIAQNWLTIALSLAATHF